ncbi:MAG TPA: hypothetical protein VFZ65_00060, partial [Planctomycetota bacterium]|nr:hypothetical protein [Planctomycetota bacterium]
QLHRGLELLRGSLPASVAPPHGRDERPPDLRAVRGAVLLAAGVPTTTTATLGATILMKKLLAVTLALLLGGAWFAWPSADGARPAPVPGTSTPPVSRGVPVADHVPPVVAASPRMDVTPLTRVGSDASAVVVRVLWSDGSPAAAMWICLEPAGAHDWFAQRWQAADGAGLVRFAPVAPGSYRARSRHGGSVDVDVAAGARDEVELRIPEGIDVRGTVVDPAGNMVPNAVIVLGTRSEDGLEAARSDGNGAFFLRSVTKKALVAAFADGFGGSRATRVAEFAQGPLELRLSDAAAVVTGRVLDADGRPLAGAWVAHGYVYDFGTDARGRPDAPAMMRVELTNAAGEFHLQGIPLGRPWPLHAGAAGHAAYCGSVRALAGEPQFVEVRLQRAVRLHGVVRDRHGEPTSGYVHVVDGNSPGEGIADQRPGWSKAFASTRDDGVFSFTNLTAGDLLVAAHDKQRNVDSHSFTARAGDDVTWDPVLTHDLAIHGRLVDEVGAPLVGWRIVAHGDEGVAGPESPTTGDGGTFRLEGCAPAAYKVRVYAPGDRWYGPVLTRHGVTPSAEPIELRVTRANMPNCTLVGRLAEGQPPGKLSVVLVGAQGSVQMAADLEPGEAFEIGPVPSGTYMLQLQRPSGEGYCQQLVSGLGTFTLAPAQRHDLGDVAMPPAGELAVELNDGDGRPVAKAGLVFALLGAPMGGTAVEIRDGRGVAEFAPGTYLPCHASDGLCIEHEPIVVAGGQRTTVQFVAAASVHRDVRYDLGAVGWMTRAFATWRKNGRPVRRQWFSFWQEKPTTHDEQFTPGMWELELELGCGRDSGSVQRFPFVVTGDDAGPVIDIVVAK